MKNLIIAMAIFVILIWAGSSWAPPPTPPLIIGTDVMAPDGDGSGLINVDAATGDSATDFFDTGTIETNFGGTGTDLSGTTGIMGMAGGVYVDIDTPQKLETYSVLGDYFSTIAGSGVTDESSFKRTTNLQIGIDVQAYDADLSTYAGITPGSYFSTMCGSGITTEAAFKAATNLEEGTDFASVYTTGYTTDNDPYTVTKTANKRIEVIELDLHAADVTFRMSETNAVDGDIVTLINVDGTYDGDMDLTIPAQQQIKTTMSFPAGEYASITLQYSTDRWVEIGRATSAASFASYTTTETEYLPIGYAVDGGTPPAAAASYTSTNSVTVRAFDGAAQNEDVVFVWQAPQDLVEASGIKVRVISYLSATATTDDGWEFEISCFTLDDGDALGASFGTEVTATSGSRTDAAYDRVATAWSNAMTDPDAGDTVHIRIERDYDANGGATDPYVADLGVAGIEIKYTRTHNTTF
jgi:hypothetical protein